MSGTKKKVKPLERPIYEIDPVTGKNIIFPLDIEAIRRDLERITSSKQGPSQKRNGPNFGRKKKESKDTEEPFKMCDIAPEPCRFMLTPLELEAMRKEIIASNNHIQQQNVKQINSGRKRVLTKESQGPSKLFDTEEIPSKLRRKEVTTKSIRKGLFSSRGDQNSRSFKTQDSSYGKQNMPKKVPKIIIISKSSPLLNMEEVEDKLINKNLFDFLSPQHCVTKCTDSKNSTSKEKTVNIPTIQEESEDACITNQQVDYEPKTPDSICEFNDLEEMCMEKNLESPITSISNLMQVTGINSSVKRTKLNFNTNIELKIAVNEVEQLIKDEETRHKENMLKLNSLRKSLMNLVGDETENKENNPIKSNRRSIRLHNKSPLKDNNGKLVFTSPTFSRSGDLLKNTLKKNLVAKHLDYQSPRTKKAMELYNSMRSINPLLETPKTERKVSAETPNSINLREMSKKLQSQCFLLQGTPNQK
ncbi:unnamed protein product [Psylliodes chrysocephalus]|uniref:Uncharacterized protein n=1 Tax=Psylliodes chrysocephalus TaxID=3402493 RepID=A0A9P0D1F1_9CUCU|nr:unnamed protein product [Psylliodes chrysocephala]